MTDSSTRRSPGRPRASVAVDRTEILEAALDAFARGGYEGLSMRAVAKSMGVSLATVQHHFGTKADLYRAMVDHTFDAERIRARSPRRDLAQRIRNLLDESSARPGLLAALLGDRSHGHQDRLAYVAARLTTALEEPAETLADLQAGASGRPVDANAFMILLIVGISSIAGAPEAARAIYGIELTSQIERNRLADALADIIGHGIFE